MTTAPETPAATLVRGNDDDELVALVALMAAKVLPLDHLAAQVEEFDSAVVVMQRVVRESMLAPAAGDVEQARLTVRSWRERQLDVRPIFNRTYPRNLRGIYNKPPLVFLRGDFREDTDAVSVAVVGTRKPSSDGIKRAQIAARRLVSADIAVFSGLAAGIDTAAHTAALDAKGRTVAVMGTGIDRVYPKENAKLARRILASGGALVSQFFPDQPPAQWTFPMRNVVMSGLTQATLVIEAGETSGARQQARNALVHGRTVFLTSSLVQQHEWAQRMATEGVDGIRAVEVSSVDEVIDRLMIGDEEPLPAVAVR